MADSKSRKSSKRTFLFLLALAFAALSGCQTPTATMDLIALGRQGLHGAKKSELDAHSERLRLHRKQLEALDTAFDTDVRLAAAGQIKDTEGELVKLSPEWIIAARKGYSAVRDVLSKNLRETEKSHAVQLDNLQAADEALKMAADLILLQWSVSERVRQQFQSLQTYNQKYLQAFGLCLV